MFRLIKFFALSVVVLLGGCKDLWNSLQMGDYQAGAPVLDLTRNNEIPMEPSTTEPALQLSLETPVRCNVEHIYSKLSTTIPFEKEAFRLEKTELSDPLPRYEVKDFGFENLTAERIFTKLLKDAKIHVVGVGGPFPELTAEMIKGELDDVVNKIAGAADVYYQYNQREKEFIVSREVNFTLSVPDKREVLIAVLDSLRGFGMHDLLVNWEEGTISFNADKIREKEVRNLISMFEKEPQIIAYDVRILRVKPFDSEVDWQDLTKNFGSQSIKMMDNGVIGKFLVTSHAINPESLVEFLSTRAQSTLVSKGVFMAANKWMSRFDVGRCGYMSMPEAQLSIMAKTELKMGRKKTNVMDSVITLDTTQGEIAHYHVAHNVGDSIVLIGIPSLTFSEALRGYETVIVLTPHIINLVKEVKTGI